MVCTLLVYPPVPYSNIFLLLFDIGIWILFIKVELYVSHRGGTIFFPTRNGAERTAQLTRRYATTVCPMTLRARASSQAGCARHRVSGSCALYPETLLATLAGGEHCGSGSVECACVVASAYGATSLARVLQHDGSTMAHTASTADAIARTSVCPSGSA